MTLVQQTCEAGVPSGTAVTAANSAHPDAYSVDPTVGTGSSVVYSSAHPVGGSLGILCRPGASAAAYNTWTGITGNTNSAGASMEIYLDALPNAVKAVFGFRSLSGGTGLMSVAIDSTGHFEILSDVDASTALSSGTLSINTAYRLEAVLTNPTTSTGAAEVRVYPSGSTSAIAGLGVVKTASNFGTATIGTLRHGWTSTGGTNTPGLYIDNVQFRTGSNSFIGAYVANTAPTAAFTHTEAALATTVDGSTSAVTTSGATISSYSWNFGDGGTATGATPAAHTYSTAGTYTVTLTVIDSNGLSNAVSHTVTVVAASRDMTVSAVTVSSGWTPSSGTVLSCLNDGDTATYITSNIGATAQELNVTMTAGIAPVTGQPYRHPVFVRRSLSSVSGTFDALLYEGATLRSTISSTAIPQASGLTWPETVLTFPWSDVSAVSNWLAVKVKILGTVA